jgi:hypothetical protein
MRWGPASARENGERDRGLAVVSIVVVPALRERDVILEMGFGCVDWKLLSVICVFY